MGFVINQYVRCVNIDDTGIVDGVNLLGALGKVEEVNHTYNAGLPYWVNFGDKIGNWYMSDINLEDASEMKDTTEYTNAKTITLKFHESRVAEYLFNELGFNIVKSNLDDENELITYILMEDE